MSEMLVLGYTTNFLEQYPTKKVFGFELIAAASASFPVVVEASPNKGVRPAVTAHRVAHRVDRTIDRRIDRRRHRRAHASQ